jgi:hypothetical protein
MSVLAGWPDVIAAVAAPVLASSARAASVTGKAGASSLANVCGR